MKEKLNTFGGNSMGITRLFQLVMVWTFTAVGFALPTPDFLRDNTRSYTDNRTINEILSDAGQDYTAPNVLLAPFADIKQLLEQQAITLNRAVINKVLMTLACTKGHSVKPTTVLTIIDYSLPSNEKRLWIFDLQQKKLLFHTYVSHGLKSGELVSNFFSNKNDSKASSLGVYRTNQSYYGREGLTLRLDGLDKGFNDNAMNRYIVMHGGWYVNEDFIKKYGRAGRSWGCPALPLDLSSAIINTIKDDTLFVVYYPNDHWLSQSRFLNCQRVATSTNDEKPDANSARVLQKSHPVVTTDNTLPAQVEREAILFVDLNGNNKHEENEPVVVVGADQYVALFNSKVPLNRMLRRQMEHKEYVALTAGEFNRLVVMPNLVAMPDKGLNGAALGTLHNVDFVIPEIIMVRGGYYETHMKRVTIGTIQSVKASAQTVRDTKVPAQYTVYLDGKSAVTFKLTNHFIRWLGL